MSASLPILTFHALDNQPSVISFSPLSFRRALIHLRERGHTTLRLKEAADYINRGVAFPPRSLVITFDDGYESVFTEALPVLLDCHMSATVFITVGEETGDRLPSLEGRSMLTWNQINEMQKCGVEIGAHSLTHPDLTRLSDDRVKAEICDSKKVIEDTLGLAVSCFAYPFGRFDSRSREIARQHFDCACSDRLGISTMRSDIYALERVDAYYLRSARAFDLMPGKLFSGYVWSRSIPRRLRQLLQSQI